MARQRFIWPDLWDDSDFGALTPAERLLFIALFSNADDHGRIPADAPNLRAIAFRFDEVSLDQVRDMRDHIVARMGHVQLYSVRGREYIQLTSWAKRQHPKYPTDSRIPGPEEADRLEPSGSVPGILPEDSAMPPPAVEERSSAGWVGLGEKETAAPASPPVRPRRSALPDEAKTLAAELRAELTARGQTVFQRDWGLTSASAAAGLLRQGLTLDDARGLMAWALADPFWGTRVTHGKHLADAAPHWQRRLNAAARGATGPPFQDSPNLAQYLVDTEEEGAHGGH